MAVRDILVELRNTTGSPIVLGTLSIPAGSSAIIWDAVDYTSGSTDNLDQVLADIAVFNEGIGNGDLVMEVDNVDQSASDAFAQFHEIQIAFSDERIKNEFTILRLESESVIGLSGVATSTDPGLFSNDGYVKLESLPEANNIVLTDGSQPLTGDLDLGSNNVINVGTVDGRDVSVDGSTLDSHVANTANPHATDIGNLGSGTLTELNSIVTDATLDDSGDPRTPTAHASTHETGGSDAIDGYNVDLVYTPVNYTAPTNDLIGEHISRIDDELGTLNSSIITDHGALTGLGDDDHTQYILVDGTRAFTGSIDVGGNSVTNVNLVDGVDVSAHAVRHETGGADAIDGYNVDLVYAPINYTAPINDLIGEHIARIDDALANAGAVTSVFGRTGDVIAVSGDYDSDQVDNVSTVTGATVSDALEDLQSQIIGGGGGTVSGPDTTTDNAIVRWNGTDGYTIQNSGIIIDDSDNITGVGTINGVTIENHSARHENGGADEISVAGLSGLLADPQTPLSHASTHISGGGDEVDGDQLDIDWNPSNYTPTTAPTEVTSLDHLTAHLAGIDTVLGTVVTDHGGLTGLGDDDHTQYLLVDGTRDMAGTLNMGENPILAQRRTIITPANINSQQDDYDPSGFGTCDILKQALTGDQTITGFAAPVAGENAEHIIINFDAVDNLTIANEGAGSVDTNRVLCPGGVDLVLGPGESTTITYDTNRWRVVAFSMESTGGASDHGALTGLGDDDHTQYLLVSGTRAMSGDLNLNSNDITNIKTATFGSGHDNGNSGSAATIDWNNSQKQFLTLTDDVTLSFTDPIGVGSFVLTVIQDATGSRTITWPTEARAPSGVAYLAPEANAISIFSVYYDQDGYYNISSSPTIQGGITTQLTSSTINLLQHASRHESGGADEIDGYQLAITYSPTNYTAPVNDLIGEHIAAIDDALAGGGGSGDVTGPVSSTDNAIVRWNGTAGDTVQNSGITIDDSNNASGFTSISIGGTPATTGALNFSNTQSAYWHDGSVDRRIFNATGGNLTIGQDVTSDAVLALIFEANNSMTWTLDGTSALSYDSVGLHVSSDIELEGNSARITWDDSGTIKRVIQGTSNTIFIGQDTGANAIGTISFEAASTFNWVLDDGGSTTVMSLTASGLDLGSYNIITSGTVDGVDVSAHASRHISAGADEIDGDQIDIDWNPSNYTPATTPTEVTSVDHLTAHLYGIDQALSPSSGTLHTFPLGNISSTGVNLANQDVYGGWITPVADFSPGNAHAGVTQAAGAGTIQIGIYTYSGSTATLITNGTSDSVSATSTGLKTFTFSTPPTLTAGTTYYVCMVASSASAPFVTGSNVTQQNQAPFGSIRLASSGTHPSSATINGTNILPWIELY